MEPFHELTMFSDAKGNQFCAHLSGKSAGIRIDSKYFFTFCVKVQKPADDLHVHGRRHGKIYGFLLTVYVHQIAVFRRGGRAGVQISVGSFVQIVHEEQCTFPDICISSIAQEVLVVGIKVVFPHMICKPCAAKRPHTPETVCSSCKFIDI